MIIDYWFTHSQHLHHNCLHVWFPENNLPLPPPSPSSFLVRIINWPRQPACRWAKTKKKNKNKSASTSWCLRTSIFCCSCHLFFPLASSDSADWSETLLSSGFFLHVQHSIGCFPPGAFTAASVRSLKQTTQLYLAFVENSNLWISFFGRRGRLRPPHPFMCFWVIYMRPALTKMTFTVPMTCTLLPQNDCICTLWLVKTKLDSFIM